MFSDRMRQCKQGLKFSGELFRLAKPFFALIPHLPQCPQHLILPLQASKLEIFKFKVSQSTMNILEFQLFFS